jgi:predicted MPP superfamily phosphohydrolase
MPKRTLTSLLLSGVLATAITAWFYVFRLAPRWVETVRLRVSVPNLPAEWEGVRISHLSDLHIGGPRVSLDMLHKARRICDGFEPDLVAITGDFFDCGVWSDPGSTLSDWPTGVPVLAVFGNHDHRGGYEFFRSLNETLSQNGVVVLYNGAAQIQLRGRHAWIVGVDDPYAFRSDAARAFSGLPDGEDALLFLAHSPAGINNVPFGKARIMLAGHTHGGQVRLMPSGEIPFIKLIRRINRAPIRNDPPFHHGIHWYAGAVVVTSNGLGVSQIPARFRTRPQVILIELTAAATEGPDCDTVERYVEVLEPRSRLLRWFS